MTNADELRHAFESYEAAESGSDEALSALRIMFRCARNGSPVEMRRFAAFISKKSDTAYRLATYYIHRAAEGGNKQSIRQLIKYYWSRNREAALMWIKKAHRAGMDGILHGLAHSLYLRDYEAWCWDSILHGNETKEQNQELAFFIFCTIPARNLDHSISDAYLIAETDVQKACFLIRKALKHASLENEDYEILSLCNSRVPEFVNLAQSFLLKLARRGNIHAQIILGDSYYNGANGFDLDKRQSIHWRQLAADKGDVRCMFNIAIMYGNGEGIRKNPKKAVYYAGVAAEMGYAEAYGQLGYYHYWGIGTKKDDVAAVECFRKSIAMGEKTVAAHNLAERYRQGEGVEKDYAQAIYYHSMAARRKYPDSICCLGIMHTNGQGMPRNETKGVRLLRRAQKLGSLRAALELGKCYDRGIGVPQNWKKAMAIYAELAEECYPESRSLLSQLKSKMKSLPSRKARQH